MIEMLARLHTDLSVCSEKFIKIISEKEIIIPNLPKWFYIR